jgi:hypothetical protein
MSYCRFSEADVYVYVGTTGYFECCGCLLQARTWVEDEKALLGGWLRPYGDIVQTQFSSTDEMLAHLELHRAAGHYVPDECLASIAADRKENDRFLAEAAAKREQVPN